MPSSPASPGRTTNSASPEKMLSSAETTSTCIVAAIAGFPSGSRALLHLLGFVERLVDGADHVERLLGQRIALTIDDHLEAADGLLERNVLARRTGEHLRDVERLRQETLDLARTRHCQFVLWRQLIHPENGDDVAQFLVALQRRLHAAGGVVVILADRVRIDLARGRIEWIDRRIYTERRDVAA